MARKLTKKQRGFVNAYADTGNGTLSVKRAKYKVSNDHSARSVASENLTKPAIKAELEKLGFDSNNAKRVVAEILNDDAVESRDRLKASELVFKVNSDFAPEKHLNVNVEIEASPEIKQLTDKLNEVYRGTSERSDGRATSVVDGEAPDQERSGTADRVPQA